MSIVSTISQNIGVMSSGPANAIDRLFLTDPQSVAGRIRLALLIRFVYLFLFIPALVIDTAVSFVFAGLYAMGSLFTSDRTQKRCIEQQQKYATQFSKSLFMIVGSLLGLIEPRVVLLFTEETGVKGIRSGGSFYYNSDDAMVKQPKTIDELKALVNDAAINNQAISIVGAGRSQGSQ